MPQCIEIGDHIHDKETYLNVADDFTKSTNLLLQDTLPFQFIGKLLGWFYSSRIFFYIYCIYFFIFVYFIYRLLDLELFTKSWTGTLAKF